MAAHDRHRQHRSPTATTHCYVIHKCQSDLLESFQLCFHPRGFPSKGSTNRMIIGWSGLPPLRHSLRTGTKVECLLGVNWYYSAGYEYNSNAQCYNLWLLVGATNDVWEAGGRRVGGGWEARIIQHKTGWLCLQPKHTGLSTLYPTGK